MSNYEIRESYNEEMRGKKLTAMKHICSKNKSNMKMSPSPVTTWPSVQEMPFIGDRIRYASKLSKLSVTKASKEIFPQSPHKLQDIIAGRYANLSVEDRVSIEEEFNTPKNWLLGSSMKPTKKVEKIEKPITTPTPQKVIKVDLNLLSDINGLMSILSKVTDSDKLYDIQISLTEAPEYRM